MQSTLAILLFCLVGQYVLAAVVPLSDTKRARIGKHERSDRSVGELQPEALAKSGKRLKRQATPDMASLMGAGGVPDMQAIQALLSQAGPGVDLSSMGLPDMETIQAMIAQAGGKK